MSEKDIAKDCCKHLDSLGVYYHAIPAVKFSKRQGGFPIGYKKGLPDLFIPRFCLYIEFKEKDSKHPPEHLKKQKEVQEKLRSEGCNVYKVEDFETFQKTIKRFYE